MNSTFMQLAGEWGRGQTVSLPKLYVEILTPSTQNVTVLGDIDSPPPFSCEREITPISALLFSGVLL